MSDREIIIKSLERAERRLRINGLFGDLTFSLSVFLLFPLAFKIWDLVSPLRGKTVAVVLGSWAVCLTGYFIWRTSRKGTLAEAASQVDRKAALCDELKTAYWFINHPHASAWVDLQIGRAAKRVSGLNMDRLYPRVIPPTSYFAAGLLALLIALNFVPLPWNHNWVYLQAAPAFSLTDAEQDTLKHTQELLKKTDQLQKTDLDKSVEDVMKQLQEGKIDVPEALKRLQEIQDQMAGENPNTANIEKALDEIAKAFESSEKLKEVAGALRDKDLKDAAQQMRKIEDHLDAATPEQMREMQKSLEEAAKNSESSLKDLSEDLKDAANSIKKEDTKATDEALEKVSEYLKDLDQILQGGKAKDAASQQVQNLQELLQDRHQGGQENVPGQKQAEQEDRTQGQSEFENDGKNVDEQEAGSSQESGDLPGMGPQSGTHPDSKAPSQAAAPIENLEVKLQQERLESQYAPEMTPGEIEKISKQERSKLDYRNVPSELSPAQKDVLNQERIPWEYRPLIKNYFEAIRPPQKDK